MATALESLHPAICPPTPRGELGETLRGLLGQKRIILASNRGPVQYTLGSRGELVGQRGQGGLVTALTSVLCYTRVAWVASCMGPGDREAARRLDALSQGSFPDGPLRLRLVNMAAKTYRRYYQVFANPLLWFIQHSMADDLVERPPSQIQTAWRWGYLPANRAVARGVLKELGQGDTAPWVFSHDYQLYVVGHFVRKRAPWALLHHFIHIPWPAPGEGLGRLGAIWQQMLHGLLSNDIIGFQTEAYARNFLEDCRLSLPAVQVDPWGQTVFYRGRVVRLRTYPISVDVAALRQEAASTEALEYRHNLDPLCGEKTIVMVERLDPSKKTDVGLQAFRLLLERHPDLVGRVKLLAFLVPTRDGIPEYKRYQQRVLDLIQSINAQFTRDGYQPIQLFYENNYRQGLAGLSLYDVLLVNSAADGMNLVAKEGPLANRKDGVLILSRGAGAYAQLSSGALSVRPGDVEDTARTLLLALSLPPEERRRRAALLCSCIEREDLTNWLAQQLQDMGQLSAERGGPSRGVQD